MATRKKPAPKTASLVFLIRVVTDKSRFALWANRINALQLKGSGFHHSGLPIPTPFSNLSEDNGNVSPHRP